MCRLSPGLMQSRLPWGGMIVSTEACLRYTVARRLE